MKIRALLCLLGVAVSGAAQAQYIWVDGAGQKHYSDRPPGAEVPQSRILRSPGASGAIVEDTAKTAGEAAASAASAPATLAQRNADFNKRRAEKEEAARKAAEAGKRTAEMTDNCNRLRNYEKSLSAGERIALPDKAGERSYLGEEQRARELREVRGQIAACKAG